MFRAPLRQFLTFAFLAGCLARGVPLVFAAPAVVPAAAGMQDAMPEPIAWRQLAFSIPFKLNPVSSPEEQPAQIRLYVSSNQGARWDVAQNVSPQERAFLFRAGGDGEYWFLIRTVDRYGRITPEVGGPPELRVIVDTVPPRLEVSATRGESGEIKATWQAVDPLLNSDSFKLEYQNSAGQWRSVAMDRPKSGGDRTATSGVLTWWPSDASESSVAVRAEISDRAGNVAVSQARATGNATPTARAAPPGVDRSIPAPLVESQAQSNNVKARRESSASARGGTSWPTGDPTASPLGRNVSSADGSFTGAAQQRDSQYIAGRNAMPFGDVIRTPIADPFRLPPDQPDGAFVNADRGGRLENVNPPIRNQVLPGLQDGAAAATASMNRPNTAQSPAGERPRMVNSRNFEMDYEIDSIGPSGVAKVELWGTRDAGRTWTSYGIDPDNRSPIRVNVENEGVYGFRIVVQSGSGLGGLPPRSGDRPELWVTVDLTRPVVRLIDAVPGSGPQGGEVLIRWEAGDAALATRPITLEFSDKPGGPWSIIAAGLENTGQFAWHPDARVPDRVYLRIEARDEAGNIGAFEATDPVPMERLRPEGKIRGVRSIDTATGGRVYQMMFR